MNQVYDGNGTLISEDQNYAIELFKITYSENTRVEGWIRLNISSRDLKKILEYKDIYLTGVTKKLGLLVEIRHIQFSPFTAVIDDSNRSNLIDISFTALDLLIKKRDVEQNIQESCLIDFYMSGMDAHKFYYSYHHFPLTNNVSTIAFLVDTQDSSHSSRFDNSHQVESDVIIRFDILETDYDSLQGSMEKAIDMVKRIILITRIAHGRWHYWKMVNGYSKNRSWEIIKWNNAASRKLVGCDIVGPRIFDLISQCYQNLLIETIEKYRLNIAIDWYIESINGETSEFKLMNGFISLELVTNLILDEKKRGVIIDENVFSRIAPTLEEKVNDILLNHGLNSHIRRKLCSKVIEINLISLDNKIQRVIKDLDINYTFGNVTSHSVVKRLIEIRNQIAHQGYYVEQDKNVRFNDTYGKLLHLIIRIFFSLLKYRGDYQLPFEKEVITYEMWHKTK